MKILVESSGGIGNLRIHGELRLDELPAELKAKAESVLAATGRRRRESQANPHMADAMSYELIFVSDGEPEQVRRISVTDAGGDDDARTLARALLREVGRKAKGAGEKP